jgi:hypothetical protein
MRYEPEHKTQTRERIVRNTARKLRAEVNKLFTSYKCGPVQENV